MEAREVIIVNEAKGNVDLYHIRVEVGGVPLWTGVYAESVERANRIAGKMFGTSNVRGRPTKVKESAIPLSGPPGHVMVKHGDGLIKKAAIEQAKELRAQGVFASVFPSEDVPGKRMVISWKKEAIGEAKGKGPHNKVKKGSQKRYKHPMSTDKPEKYIGKWEAYDVPQGVGSKAANVTMKPPANESQEGFKKINPHRIQPVEGDKIEYAAQFEVNGRYYVAWAESDEEYPGLYYFSFESFGSRSGDTKKVFASVFPIIKDFLDSKEIPAIMFNGRDPQQKILYKKIVDRYGDSQIHPKYGKPRNFEYEVKGPVLQHTMLPLHEEVMPDVKTYSPQEIARKHGVDLADIMGQLRMGIKAEYEHTKDPQLAKEIALDHLLEMPDYYTKLERMEEGHSMGPAFSRGLTNSSTGRGAAPPETDFNPKDLSNVLRPRKKQPGSKARTREVEKTVSKSLTDKVRKLNAKVTEMEIPTRLDELFGQGQTLQHDYNPRGYSEIIIDDETNIIVGFEDIQAYVPGAKPGLNAGFATMHNGQIMHGLERENLQLDRRTLFALFNTVIEIVQRWVEDNNPERVYFVAVEPMKNIYPRLIKKFVDSEEWRVSKANTNIPAVGQSLDVYMCERRSIAEMVRLPIQTKFNADYEVKDGEKTVGMAKVTDGVIGQLMINQEEAEEQFNGHALSMTLGTIIRDADLQNANLAMQIADLEDQDMKRYLERFGFRHTGQGIFKRTAGSITPPSVIEDKLPGAYIVHYKHPKRGKRFNVRIPIARDEMDAKEKAERLMVRKHPDVLKKGYIFYGITDIEQEYDQLKQWAEKEKSKII